MKHYYAQTHPRGFANEYTIIAFDTRAARDAYVAATDRTYAITRKAASAAIRWHGDACTQDYSGSLNCYIEPNISVQNWNDYDRLDAIANISDAMRDNALPAGASQTPVAI